MFRNLHNLSTYVFYSIGRKLSQIKLIARSEKPLPKTLSFTFLFRDVCISELNNGNTSGSFVIVALVIRSTSGTTNDSSPGLKSVI
jgi:hypothetical protein